MRRRRDGKGKGKGGRKGEEKGKGGERDLAAQKKILAPPLQ